MFIRDWNFGFTAGELETVDRVRDNNIVLFDSLSFGWIRAEWLLSYGEEYVDFATGFRPVDYMKIAEGFGLRAYRVEGPRELGPTLREAFGLDESTFTEVRVLPEDELVPPSRPGQGKP